MEDKPLIVACVPALNEERTIGRVVLLAQREPRIGDVRQSCADIGKAEKELGYKPRFSLQKALMDFVDCGAK